MYGVLSLQYIFQWNEFILWTTFILIGLLVEPSKDYATLLTRNRKVTSINACLSKDGSPHVVEFQSYGAIGGIKGKWQKLLICKYFASFTSL